MSLRTEKAVVSVTLAAILGPLFFRVSALTASRSIPPPPWLVTPLDEHVPLVPAAVWLYLSWYPICAVGLFAGRTTLRRTYCAYTLAFLACLVGYLVVPVSIVRPTIPDGAGLSLAMLRALYAVDPPVNVFPSFHAAIAAILWRLRPGSRIASVAVSAWTVGLCISCVLTKQHYVLDVMAGFVVGVLAVGAVDVARLWIASLPMIERQLAAGRASASAE
jgi:membrane-associated phospholipid phosphatase